MKNLRLFFLMTFVFAAVSASAQLSFGVKAGLNMSTITDVEDSDMKIGYKVGPTVEYMFAPNMGIQSGLLLSSKGVKSSLSYHDDYENETINQDATINSNYLELPILFAYKFAIAPDTKVYLNAGPYLAYGIFGKTKFKYTIDGYSGDYEVKYDTFGDDYYDENLETHYPGMERFDFGLSFGAGMEITKFNFGLNYDLGLKKVYDVDGDSPKNSNFWISAGYKF